jgi:inner membrane protein
MAMSKAVSLFLKLVIIGGLTLVILGSLALVDSAISERQNYRNEAVESISSSYASDQRILGPLLVQPYRQTVAEETTDDKGVKKTTLETIDSTYSTFPDQLNIKGEIKPDVRRHGLYRVPVYTFQGVLNGHITVPAPALKGDIVYGVPYLAFTVKDARGIVGRPVLRVNGVDDPVLGATLTTQEQDNLVHPALAWGTNLRALVPQIGGKGGSLDFTLDLTLNGTQQLELVPLADTNHFELSSPWAAPLLAGQFLPNTHEISKDGFHAVWNISSLASATQQKMSAGTATSPAENVDVVSVSLTDLIDPYKLSNRAVKYGILFVLLTFGGFFLFEMGKRMLIHPVQYLLVGFCLSVFFLLLVSFSEHLPFGVAYLISSVACIGLLTYYLVFVLHSKSYGVAFGGILATLYAAIYGLLISEDNALLLGSLLLFGVIAIVMIATRKIDWYQRTADLGQAKTPPVPHSDLEIPRA